MDESGAAIAITSLYRMLTSVQAISRSVNDSAKKQKLITSQVISFLTVKRFNPTGFIACAF